MLVPTLWDANGLQFDPRFARIGDNRRSFSVGGFCFIVLIRSGSPENHRRHWFL
jgi:hypothetical protein